ncbi:MAG: bifunctional ornithine acetyltransferase/N-acetylglutamate synthase [Candidatus Hydrothermarchaeaceae archaeon]
MREIDKGVCVQGFRAGGVKKGKYGVSVILSKRVANCALMVTSNRVKAAPILVSMENAKAGRIRGIVANSGNANAYSGASGVENAREMCRRAAEELELSPENFIVASTGMIGRKMDMGTIAEHIETVSKNLDSSVEAAEEAARGIMTTDTFRKLVSVETKLEDGTRVEIGGIAKGAGMIAPDLKHATMLCFITTNAYVPPGKIKTSLGIAVEQSFNMAVVDRDTSTNDMVVLMANGIAGNKGIDGNFQEALNYVARELAKMIVKDGEGATKYVEVTVRNALTIKDAKAAAKAVAGSNLVKTALFGGDPNWGRIIAAVGYSGAEIAPDKITLAIGDKRRKARIIDRGRVIAFKGTKELKKAENVLRRNEVYIDVDLGMGRRAATAYGCDMGYDYIKINSQYST